MTIRECIKCHCILGCGESLKTMTPCSSCKNAICENVVTLVHSRLIEISSGLCSSCFDLTRKWNKGLVFVGENGV